MSAQRTLSTVCAAVFCCAGCVGSGEFSASVSGQIVDENEKPLGPGLVLIELGAVHDGAYKTGALIDEKGHFSAKLSQGGTWGLHLFHDDYSYLPLEITIENNQQVTLTSMDVVWGAWLDLTGLPMWPDQPSDSRLIRLPVDDLATDNPVLGKVTMKYLSSELMEVTAEASDPNNDLSRMVLAYDPTAADGYAFNPPSPPDSKGNYPNGTYKFTAYIDKRHVPGQSKWYFVVSDMMCNNSPIKVVTMPPR